MERHIRPFEVKPSGVVDVLERHIQCRILIDTLDFSG